MNEEHPSLPAFGKMLLGLFVGRYAGSLKSVVDHPDQFRPIPWDNTQLRLARKQCRQTAAGASFYKVVEACINCKAFENYGRLKTNINMKRIFLERILKIPQNILKNGEIEDMDDILRKGSPTSSTASSPCVTDAVTLPHVLEASSLPHDTSVQVINEKARFAQTQSAVLDESLTCSSSASRAWLATLKHEVHPIIGRPDRSLVRIAILDTGINLDSKMQRFCYHDCVKQYWSWSVEIR